MPRGKGTKTNVPPLTLLEVEECMTRGWSRMRIVGELAKPIAEGGRGVVASTVYDWIAKVHARWAEEAEAGRPIRKAQLRAMNLAAFELAMRTKQPSAAVAAAAAIAKLDQLDEPTQHEIGMTVRPLSPDEEQAALTAFMAQHSTLPK